jgi:Tol biopolymer transport system component
MSTGRWQEIDEILQELLDGKHGERGSFLARRCQTDHWLRSEIESLLAAHDNAGSFMQAPPSIVASEFLAENAPGLAVGQWIGGYRITSVLGTGGMGKVYRAHDSRLDRAVALKIIPPEFRSDTDRLRRFQKEARSVTALTHPNIVTVYDIGQSGNTPFIVTEIVEGKTLRQILNEGRPDRSRVLSIGIQLASALGAAHSVGIIHRDIKPENLMVRPDGYVKVLDFGLAKLTRGSTNLVNGDPSPTFGDTAGTDDGVILGTVDYMSPEQAEGRGVNASSDIFSFGAVLYEMFGGQRAFQRDTKLATLAALLKEQPPPLRHISEDLQGIVGRCLQKEPSQRFQHMDEVKAALERAALVSVDPPLLRAFRNKRLVWVAACSLLLLIVLTSWFYFSGTSNLPASSIPVPVTSLPGHVGQPAFSPDGNRIAFVWEGETQRNLDIYVQSIGGGRPVRLTNNPAIDSVPAWSADGRRIAFYRNSGGGHDVITIPALGGPERTLCHVKPEAMTPQAGSDALCIGLSWSPDGDQLAIVDRALPTEANSIFLLSTETGEKRQLTSSPPGSLGDARPAFSRDGRMLAFVRIRSYRSSELFVQEVQNPGAREKPRQLTFDDHSIFGFDWTPDGKNIVFSSSREGSAALWLISPGGGTPQRVALTVENPSYLSVAPVEGRLAYVQNGFDTNIWRIPGPRSSSGNAEPVRFIASTRRDNCPMYSADGMKIAFASRRSGTPQIWICESDGTNPAPLTYFRKGGAGSPRWSPDGRRIAFDYNDEGQTDIYVVSSDGGTPRRFTTEAREDVRPSWSRDGRWIYFGSNRSGEYQIWKMPSDGGAPLRVTRKGGFEAFESADGKTLIYTPGFVGQRGIWSMPVEGGEEKLLFQQGGSGRFAVTDEGIYVRDPGGPTAAPSIQLFRFATLDWSTVRAFSEDTRLVGASTAVSPDNRWILYVQLDHVESEIILLENFRP